MNGITFVLESSVISYAGANAVQILDTNVYIAGTVDAGASTDVCYENGVRHSLTVNPIFVITKPVKTMG
jgi:hypothetical protein